MSRHRLRLPGLVTRPLAPIVRPKRPGASPGTLVHVGERHVERPRLHVFSFSTDRLEEADADSVDEALAYRKKGGLTWVDVTGLHDTDLVALFGERLGIHPLVQEDLLNTNQRPKHEDYAEYAFLVLKMLRYDEAARAIDVEQVSLVVFPDLVLTFQEKPGDVFDPVRERLRQGRKRLRSGRGDYLAYALVDAIVDHLSVVMDGVDEALAGLENRIVETPRDPRIVEDVHEQRRALLAVRRSVAPTRDLLNGLEKGTSPHFGEETRVYLRDVDDHALRALDQVDAHRETSKNLLDLYLSLSSHRMNEVMKVLTIIATVFLPLTFIAGVYGMNFEHMPELDEPWAYPAVWVVMLAVAATMLMLFRRKAWL